jgi:DNA polymerase III subunit epsilon
MRQIFLDTETTGLRVEDGHRIIEIGCLEMIDRKLTGKHYHKFINPEREVEAAALAVHGISNDILHDKPLFSHIANELMEFISGDELIIHNAPFDLSFLNNELLLTRQGWNTIADYCGVIDTLQMARQLHVGQRNSLDALCKRYGVDNSKREMHGALLDTHLLAQVYLAMTGGQGSFFETNHEREAETKKRTHTTVVTPLKKHNLVVLRATDNEVEAHHQYLELLRKQGNCVWDKQNIDVLKK